VSQIAAKVGHPGVTDRHTGDMSRLDMTLRLVALGSAVVHSWPVLRTKFPSQACPGRSEPAGAKSNWQEGGPPGGGDASD
jgi:hypothetical protein